MNDKRTLRDESTPVGKKIWAAVDKTAARAPVPTSTPKPTAEDFEKTKVLQLTSGLMLQLDNIDQTTSGWKQQQFEVLADAAVVIRRQAFEGALERVRQSSYPDAHPEWNEACQYIEGRIRALAKEQPSTET